MKTIGSTNEGNVLVEMSKSAGDSQRCPRRRRSRDGDCTMTMITEQYTDARVRVSEQPRAVITWRWCPVCMTRTDHASEEHGGWERVVCLTPGCGHTEEYRTR